MSRKFNAILGLGALAAFGFASSAFAQCPTGPVPPWSFVTPAAADNAVAISAGGYDGTSCKLAARLNASAGALSQAIVRDDTPVDEARYRAQFLLNADSLTNLVGLQSVQVFSVQSAAAGPSNSRLMLRAVVQQGGGGSGKAIRFFQSCNTPPSFRCAGAAIDLANGTNRIEIDLATDAAGSTDIWVNNTNANTPTQTITGDNAGWVGVDRVFVGLAGPSYEYVTQQAGRDVFYDEFDSRRQSFIGN